MHTHTTSTYNARAHTHARAHTRLGDLRKILLGFNRAQQLAVPYAKLMEMLAEFDEIAGSLDQRVFNAFDKLDLLSPAARNLALQVADKRQKRRAADDAADAVVPPGASTPAQGRAGACRCKTAPLCMFRCPCRKLGQNCSTLCLCEGLCEFEYD